MFSIFPALMSLAFLFAGLYLVNQKGVNRVSVGFLAFCITAFFWQFIWAAFYQARDPDTANQLIKMGWLINLVLPTAFYHLICEAINVKSDQKFITVSYFCSLILVTVLISSNNIIDGYHQYSWGYYPKAAPLLILHICQSIVVVARALFICHIRFKASRGEERGKIGLCFAGILFYLGSFIDLLPNYGIEIYPSGILFAAVSLGCIAVALARFQLIDSARLIAASVAHEMRTPMATLKLQAQVLSIHMPTLIKGYETAVQNGLCHEQFDKKRLDAISNMADKIQLEINRSNQVIDMLLAMSSESYLDRREFKVFSVGSCLQENLEKYPFEGEEKSRVTFELVKDFYIFGSETFLAFTIFNLIKNSLYALREKGSGEILIKVDYGYIEVKDTGQGIPDSIQPYIFDNFFSTKSRTTNAGVGLSFCKRVIESFGGKILCRSEYGEGTTFTLQFYPKSHYFRSNFPS